jgi:hypothetical protein
LIVRKSSTARDSTRCAFRSAQGKGHESALTDDCRHLRPQEHRPIGITDEQRSVARQVEHAQTYAARKGWRVLDEHVYVDDGISGAEFANRPGFLRWWTH